MLFRSQGQQWDIETPVYRIPKYKSMPMLGRISALEFLAEDMYMSWLVRSVSKIIKRVRPDLIFSFANPHSSNILGARLKDVFGIPFVSHFSDPFIGNHYKKYSESLKRRMLCQEKDFVEKSDAVVFVTDQMRSCVMNKYAGSVQAKGYVIPHCYDPEAYSRQDEREREGAAYTISHMGAFYPQRTPRMFFEAVQLVFKGQAELLNTLRIDLYGAVREYTTFGLDELNTMVAEYGLSDIVRSEERRVGKECRL